jgi:hypothetical protein
MLLDLRSLYEAAGVVSPDSVGSGAATLAHIVASGTGTSTGATAPPIDHGGLPIAISGHAWPDQPGWKIPRKERPSTGSGWAATDRVIASGSGKSTLRPVHHPPLTRISSKGHGYASLSAIQCEGRGTHDRIRLEDEEWLAIT